MIELTFAFLGYGIIQALVINGIYESFKGEMIVDKHMQKTFVNGNIFFLLFPKFITKHRAKKWAKPFFGCVKCMASFWGALTFFPPAFLFFGFTWVVFFGFVLDVFMLVSLNWLVYKML